MSPQSLEAEVRQWVGSYQEVRGLAPHTLQLPLQLFKIREPIEKGAPWIFDQTDAYLEGFEGVPN